MSDLVIKPKKPDIVHEARKHRCGKYFLREYMITGKTSETESFIAGTLSYCHNCFLYSFDRDSILKGYSELEDQEFLTSNRVERFMEGNNLIKTILK